MNNKNNGLIGSRIYLYVTEFFAGMAVMAVELGASRLLAPYFSSSQIVWTIIIGTIMIAMALGNIYGGRTADKDPSPDRLYKRILIAAVWIAAIPAIGKYIIVGITGLLVVTVNSGFLIIAAFAACMVLFVFPLFLLGTVTPSLVKYTTDNLDSNGRVVGTLGAANTIGSIIGTFLPTFVTIPSVGTAITFLLFSGIVLVIGVIYFISVKRKIVAVIVCTVLFIICSIFGNRSSFAFWDDSLEYEGESVYNYLQVKDDSKKTILSTNVMFGVQSVTMKEPGLTGMYYDYAMAAPVMCMKNHDHINMLILGMGTGTYARQCLYYFENEDMKITPQNITGVEIDEKITELSGEYFDASPDVNVVTYDGRAFIDASDEKYDVIMVDAYQDITIPFQMSSAEFFTQVRDHLTDDGVMVVNLNMRADSYGNSSEAEEGNAAGSKAGMAGTTVGSSGDSKSGRASINTYICDTISSVFGDVATIDVPRSTNRELFAMKRAGSIDTSLDAEDLIHNDEMKWLIGNVRDNLEHYNAGNHVFTDDWSPVELLGMYEIDDIIKKELEYYKKAFKEEGLAGVLDSI